MIVRHRYSADDKHADRATHSSRPRTGNLRCYIGFFKTNVRLRWAPPNTDTVAFAVIASFKRTENHCADSNVVTSPLRHRSVSVGQIPLMVHDKGWRRTPFAWNSIGLTDSRSVSKCLLCGVRDISVFIVGQAAQYTLRNSWNL